MRPAVFQSHQVFLLLASGFVRAFTGLTVGLRWVHWQRRHDGGALPLPASGGRGRLTRQGGPSTA